jgi:HAD superfamily hydrolase (TIGR01484 family)
VTRIEAVVTDLDGTLVGADFRMSPATLQALDMLRSARIPLVVATARTPPGLRLLSALSSRVDIAVCCSGAIGWSGRGHHLWQENLAPETIGRIVETAVQLGAGVAGFDGTVWRATPAYQTLSPQESEGPYQFVVDPQALAASRCCSMAVRHTEKALAHVTRSLTSEVYTALSRVAGSVLLDITPPGVDKGSGTLRALAALGIDPAAAISFGDMPADLPLFEVTARGYAVGNSQPAVVSAADEVLEPIEHDGFSRKIAELAAAGWDIA